MPVSKKRKKKGKRVNGGTKLRVDPNKKSSISLQDLINVVGYQEFKAGNYDPPPAPEAAEIYAKVGVNDDTEIAPGVILRADSVINVQNGAEVLLEDTRGNKIGVGTVSPVPGDDGHVNLTITDPDILAMVQAPVGDFSIDRKE